MFEELIQYYENKGVEITTDLLKVFQENLIEKKIKKGEIILNPGDSCTHVFFVAIGLLRGYTIDPSGKEHILQFAPENWLISDRSSVLFNDKSELYIEAVEDSKIIMISEEFFNNLSELSSSFRNYNLFALNNHIRHLHKRINLLLSATAEVRYLDFIKLYPDVTLRVPQWMIASYLGITPESLSRVRKELAHKNFKPGK
ncbi:MAG TPA: Crp/Fnr family transcriptional regulator [Moheibacter sp.]|nr:Crp/Fnr family transcriptional regulator [Moheibacter sp.]